MNDIIGKTVANVEEQQWAGRDTFKDDVTWVRTVITFTDGSSIGFDSWDGEVYDPYLYSDIDEDGHPVPLTNEYGLVGMQVERYDALMEQVGDHDAALRDARQWPAEES